MDIGRIRVTASRWPWQVRTSSAVMSCRRTEKVGDRYGWKATDGMGRFGAGWQWKLGIDVGSSSIILNLVFGMVRIGKVPRP